MSKDTINSIAVPSLERERVVWLWLHTEADGVACWDAGVRINIPTWNAVGLLAIPDPDYWSAVPDLPIAVFWKWHGAREQTAGTEKTRGWGRVAPIATPQHNADKSQSHLTKSLTTKQLAGAWRNARGTQVVAVRWLREAAVPQANSKPAQSVLLHQTAYFHTGAVPKCYLRVIYLLIYYETSLKKTFMYAIFLTQTRLTWESQVIWTLTLFKRFQFLLFFKNPIK